MTIISQNNAKFNKNNINFEGGNLSSNSGAIILNDFLNKINFRDLLKKHSFNDKKITRFIQRILLTTLGFNSDTVLKDLKEEPILLEILGVSALASQSTMSRFDNSLDELDLEKFQAINLELLEKSYKIKMPTKVLLDVDTTGITTYGKQSEADYNPHYKSHGYQPIVLYDSLTKDFIAMELRPGSQYSSKGAVEFLKPILEWYKLKFPSIKLEFRGDSGFASPEIYRLLELHNVEYAIRMKINKRLHELRSTEEELFGEEDLRTYFKETLIAYDEFEYKAGTWKKERIIRTEVKRASDEFVFSYTYIVSNMKKTSRGIIEFYRDRGEMENFIKESKNGFFMKNLSHKTMITNWNKALILMIVYTISNLLKNLTFPKELKKLSISTVRNKFYKIASRCIKSGRKLLYKFDSNYPYKKELFAILENIKLLPI